MGAWPKDFDEMDTRYAEAKCCRHHGTSQPRRCRRNGTSTQSGERRYSLVDGALHWQSAWRRTWEACRDDAEGQRRLGAFGRGSWEYTATPW